MRAAYFDASAIVKLSRLEAESQALIDYLLDDELAISTSTIAHVEVVRTLRRMRAERTDIDDAVRGFYLLSLDPDIRLEAAQLGSETLRALDAIHVATALAIGDPNLELVTYDDRVAAAARECGLKVVQPGR